PQAQECKRQRRAAQGCIGKRVRNHIGPLDCRIQEAERQRRGRQFIWNDKTPRIDDRNRDHENRQPAASCSTRIGEQDQACDDAQRPRNNDRNLFRGPGRRQRPRNQGGPTRQHFRSSSRSDASVRAATCGWAIPRKLSNYRRERSVHRRLLKGTAQLGAKLFSDEVSINAVVNDLRPNEDDELGSRFRYGLVRKQITHFWNLIKQWNATAITLGLF